jgi:hypothetical protein
MGTLFRIGSCRIVVYSNDHRPPHVHAVGDGYARFDIGDMPDDVRPTEQAGVSVRELRRIASEIVARHAECLAAGRNIMVTNATTTDAEQRIHAAVDDQLRAATLAGKARRDKGDLAASAAYDSRSRRLRIELMSGVGVSIPVSKVEGLAGAPASVIRTVRVEGGGYGLHWPSLDLDIAVPDLIAGFLGSRAWMSALARQGAKQEALQSADRRARTAEKADARKRLDCPEAGGSLRQGATAPDIRMMDGRVRFTGASSRGGRQQSRIFSNRSKSLGFCTKNANGEPWSCSTTVERGNAVYATYTASFDAASLRSLLAVSKPSIPGMPRSRTMSCGLNVGDTAIASNPLLTTRTSQPASSKSSPRMSAPSGSSSAMSTRIRSNGC